MGLSAARSTSPGASPKSCWVAAVGQCYPAQGATASTAGSSLSLQLGRASYAPRCQQPSVMGSFSFDDSVFVFRPQMQAQVSIVVSMVSYQASGDPYLISRRNLLYATQQHLLGTSKCGGEQFVTDGVPQETRPQVTESPSSHPKETNTTLGHLRSCPTGHWKPPWMETLPPWQLTSW